MYKVAVASSDGKVVNQHFGRATQFLIFDVQEDGSFQFVTLRKNEPICKDGEHLQDALAYTLEQLSDCQAVVVSQVGPGVSSVLVSRGIYPFVYPDFIEDSLKWLADFLNKETE